MLKNILLWDNDGTITRSKNPQDTGTYARVIFPGVKKTMQNAHYNFVISGFSSPESDLQDFDPDKVAAKFIQLMEKLPINAVVFSPLKGAIACYSLLREKDGRITLKKSHEDPRYKDYIGKFKKPEIGMFVVLKDIAWEEFGQIIKEQNALMIGDTWQDEKAAAAFGIPFLNAKEIHKNQRICL